MSLEQRVIGGRVLVGGPVEPGGGGGWDGVPRFTLERTPEGRWRTLDRLTGRRGRAWSRFARATTELDEREEEAVRALG